jgi:hypothetical protein
VVLGTWEEEGTFHVSLRDRDTPEDPLHLPLFSDFLPYHCITHVGVYTPECYSITPPQAIITLPTTGLATHTGLFTILPPDLQKTLQEGPAVSPSQVEAAIIIHSCPRLEVSQQPEVREVNLVLHTWAFAGTDPASLTDDEQSSPHIVVEVGVFGGEAVSETAQNICEELNGVAVGRMGPRILYMHNMSLSPHNCQLALQAGAALHAFFCLARHPPTGTVLTYHILPSTEMAEAQLKQALHDSRTVEDMIHHMTNLVTDFPPMKSILSTLHNLCTSA